LSQINIVFDIFDFERKNLRERAMIFTSSLMVFNSRHIDDVINLLEQISCPRYSTATHFGVVAAWRQWPKTHFGRWVRGDSSGVSGLQR